MDRVLVIIVTYNAHGWIRQCIDSVDRQHYDVLVVDNASGDDTVGIIRTAYPDVRLFLQTENLGFGKANNIGLRYAVDNAYDYVLLLNQDAWLLPDTIEKLIIAHKQQPQYWILSPMQMNSKTQTVEKQFQRYLDQSTPALQKDELVDIDFVNAAVWLLPLQTIMTVGGFCPVFHHYGEDNDYVNRMHYWGGKIGVVSQSIAFHDRIYTGVAQKVTEYRIYLGYLCILHNINAPYLVNQCKSVALLVRKYIKSILCGRWEMIRCSKKAFHKATVQKTMILKSRETAKQERAFL